MFLTIWQLVAEHYKDWSNRLCFELLNEPHTTEGGNLDVEHLNELQNKVIPIIRETNPTRIIIAAAADWNGAWTLDRMELPADDGHIAIACHTYEPLDFTHQGATWAEKSKDQVRFSVTDTTETGIANLAMAFANIKMWKDRTGIPVILNEFGVNHYNNNVDKGDVTQWLNYVTQQCRKYDVSWTYWEYNSGFGAYQNGKWLDYVVKGLGLE